MTTQNEEDLKGLFERFVGGEQADEAAADIRKGEQILQKHPAPGPDDKLITDIKAKTAEAILQNKPNAFKNTAYKVAAVAAVIVIVTALAVTFSPKGDEAERIDSASIVPAAVWDSENIAADDEDLAILTAEKELMKLEMELVEINGDFWKG